MNEDQENSPLRTRIAHARGRRASRRRHLLRALTGAVLLALAGTVGVWIGLQLVRESPATRPSAGESGTTVLPRAESTRAGEARGSAPADEARSTRAHALPAPLPAGAEPSRVGPSPEPADGGRSPTASPAVATGDSTRSVASQRARFEEALHRLEITLHSGPAGAPSRPELDAALERIRLQEAKAIEALDDGDTDSALRLLTEAEREAGELIRNEEARFRINLQAALDAYAGGNPADARMHVARALEYRPDDPAAISLEARIVQLPELLAVRRRAAHTRDAGKLQEERAALRRIVELDPGDAQAGDRARAVERAIGERAFARTIALGRQAIEDRALEPARQALAEAERREPQHAHTGQLRTRVTELERILTRDRHLVLAEQAAAKDDWEAALRAFDSARTIEPTHDGAVNGSALATRLVDAQRTVDEFLSRRDRLGSAGVADAARDTLRDAAALTALSARLARSVEELEHAIETWQTPVPVRVVSDDLTEIGVRGVGMIGRTRARTIELRPGEYVFEGKREGYRSKLVEVVVQANAGAPVEVRIVCDERS